ncbi:right-handed parallel beta-helix repeat-containing protein [Puteibacter caeruleilacunae]|nr:right-handed parallel beta-helix repeat-containing protein [Puteibacter caeruleilacunae]
MRKKIYLFLGLCLCCWSVSAREIKLSNYGVKPWSFENASAAVFNALNDAKGEDNVVLKLPGGRVDLWPEGAPTRELYISNTTENDYKPKIKHVALLLEGMKNITIEGNNTLLVLHGKMVSFAIINSTNVTIKDVEVDYDRPSMSELKVVESSKSRVKLGVHSDSKFVVKEGQSVFYGEGWRSNHLHSILMRPEQNMMHYSSWKPFENAKIIDYSADHITFEGDFAKSDLRKGDVLTVRDPYRDNCGAFISLSKDVVLENVKMHYMHGLGVLSQFTENITLKSVEVGPREESGRVIAAFADCFHFSGCRGVITVDSCRTSGSHDDPMNVHGTHLKITKLNGPRQAVVRFMHHQTYGFEAFFKGDSVAFVSPENLLIHSFGKIKSAKMTSKREMLLDFEEDLPVSLKEGDCVENVSWTPEVIVKNCHFQRTNTRGLLVTTRRKVLIENNTFYRTGMHGILIANDCNFWYESGPVTDITIRGNKFIQCGYNQGHKGYVISIQPETHNFIPRRYIHSNITIENNEITCGYGAVLFARATDGIRFINNTITYKPILKAVDGMKALFELEHCNDVEIKENRVDGFSGASLVLSSMKKKQVKQNSLDNLTVKMKE